MLGGMWGFANTRNRPLSRKLFSILVNKRIASRYFQNGYSKKGLDQDFLGEFFWKYAKKNATVHDSYTCNKFYYEPFSTQRPNSFCYVSCIDCCDFAFNNKSNHECPMECRPKEHRDWNFC
jgi:hypothetical protein